MLTCIIVILCSHDDYSDNRNSSAFPTLLSQIFNFFFCIIYLSSSVDFFCHFPHVSVSLHHTLSCYPFFPLQSQSHRVTFESLVFFFPVSHYPQACMALGCAGGGAGEVLLHLPKYAAQWAICCAQGEMLSIVVTLRS